MKHVCADCEKQLGVDCQCGLRDVLFYLDEEYFDSIRDGAECWADMQAYDRATR